MRWCGAVVGGFFFFFGSGTCLSAGIMSYVGILSWCFCAAGIAATAVLLVALMVILLIVISIVKSIVLSRVVFVGVVVRDDVVESFFVAMLSMLSLLGYSLMAVRVPLRRQSVWHTRCVRSLLLLIHTW